MVKMIDSFSLKLGDLLEFDFLTFLVSLVRIFGQHGNQYVWDNILVVFSYEI